MYPNFLVAKIFLTANTPCREKKYILIYIKIYWTMILDYMYFPDCVNKDILISEAFVYYTIYLGRTHSLWQTQNVLPFFAMKPNFDERIKG